MIEYLINHAPTIATIGFFIAFLYIAFFALRKKNKKRFEDDAKIPFRDEE